MQWEYRYIDEDATPLLPSVSELAIYDFPEAEVLEVGCPVLQILRFFGLRNWHNEMELEEQLEDLSSLLLLRRESVAAGKEIDGVKMENIKKVYTSYKRNSG